MAGLIKSAGTSMVKAISSAFVHADEAVFKLGGKFAGPNLQIGIMTAPALDGRAIFIGLVIKHDKIVLLDRSFLIYRM